MSIKRSKEKIWRSCQRWAVLYVRFIPFCKKKMRQPRLYSYSCGLLKPQLATTECWKWSFKSLLQVLMRLLTKLRENANIWLYLLLCSSEIMNLIPAFGAIQNTAKLPTYTWKICKNCKYHLLHMLDSHNRLMHAQDWTWFWPKCNLCCHEIFSNLTTIFHFKIDLF